MSNVVQLFASSGDDDGDEYVPSFPVSDEAATMRERANRIYSRHLVERGFSKGEVDGDGLTASERGGHAKASAYRDGWTADDQADVDAWLETDPWASRLAMKLDELAGAPRDPPRRFLAPVEGPAEVVESISVVAPVVPSERHEAGATTAGEPEEENAMRKKGADGLTDIQRNVLKTYGSTPFAKQIAAKLSLPHGTVKGTIHSLRAMGLIAPSQGHGKMPVAKVGASVSKPKIADATSPTAVRAASALEEDPLLEAMRQRREALIAEHRTRLARIDAAIAAFEGAV